VKRFPVAVVGGGWSGERSISLLSAAGVAAALQARGWRVDAVDLQPDRAWVRPTAPRGFTRVRVSDLTARLRRRPGTLAFLALHGPYGEDGRVQGLLEMAGLPFTGSGSLASALAMDKAVAKQLLRAAGVPVPGGLRVERGALPASFRLPAVVKPVSQGSALGVTLARSRSQLRNGLARALRLDRAALLEPYLAGRELTVGVLGEAALPVVEIVPKHAFYDFHSKYAQGGSRHLCPAPIPAAVARRAQALALRAHRALGCRAYSRTDLIWGRDGKLHVLEVNTLPGLTRLSLLPDAAKAAGLDYGELLERMMELSLREAGWRSTKG
jgi:D-alanine-D-alanine ligase